MKSELGYWFLETKKGRHIFLNKSDMIEFRRRDENRGQN